MVFTPPFFGLGGLFQALKPVIPELFHKPTQLAEPFRASLIQPPCPIAAHADQARRRKHLEMLRDRWARHVEVRGDLSRRKLGALDQPQDISAARLHERL
jgi:hypothetical protein